MKLENQLDILERLLKLNGNLDSLWSEVSPDGSIEAAIHQAIDELERNEIEPGTARRIYLEGRA